MHPARFPSGRRARLPIVLLVGALCENVDVDVVRSLVGVRDVPDPATTAVDTGSGWTCTWLGDYRSTGPNGQVAQPKVDVVLYRAPLEITEGGEAPTTVAGRAGTIRKVPGPRPVPADQDDRRAAGEAVRPVTRRRVENGRR